MSVTDGLGNVTTFTYDAKGMLTSVKDANRNAPNGPVEAGVAQCGDYETGDGFDDDGDQIIDDGCPRSMLYVYDSAGRLEKVVEAAFQSGGGTVYPITTYEYDLPGYLIVDRVSA